MPNYTRLTSEQRYTIEALLRKGCKQVEIAQAIKVSPSTLSRELRRFGPDGPYSAIGAQRDAELRRKRDKHTDPRVLELVNAKLREGQWSPEQISKWLLLNDVGRISHETIYQHIYRDKARGGDLHTHLRHRIKSYRKRSCGRERRGRLKDQVMIDQRPAVVDERSRIGDWEMDTVIGRPGGPVLVTMVERTSRYTVIRLARSKDAIEVGAAILAGLGEHRARVFTKTYDNGKEFAHHKLVAEILGAEAYFAHPYHSWERGLNENTNGLIRQYFPKGTDLRTATPAQIAEVESKLNHRPRKCLAYRTPHDIFHAPPPIALAA